MYPACTALKIMVEGYPADRHFTVLTYADINTNSSVSTSEHHTVHRCKDWGTFCK